MRDWIVAPGAGRSGWERGVGVWEASHWIMDAWRLGWGSRGRGGWLLGVIGLRGFEKAAMEHDSETTDGQRI